MARILLIAILISTLSASGCNYAFRVPTEGMLPTIGRDDMLIGDPLGLQKTSIERFDIVVFKAPAEERDRFKEQDIKYVMRIIGLPGETIEIRNNQILINGQILEEPFEKIIDENDWKRNFAALKIPENEYFMIGDNRPNSSDSRYWKRPTIKKSDIVTPIVEIKKDYYKKK